MKIRTIVFPTDFSPDTRATAEYASDIAQKYGATVYLLHVIYDIARDSGWYGSHLDLETLYADVKKSAEAELDRIAGESFPGSVKVEKVLIVGTPYEDILAFAREKNADLIVIGSHGRKALGRVLFGSTVQKVLRRALCPVLTVRQRK